MIIFGQHPAQFLDHRLRLDGGAVAVVTERMLLLPFRDLRVPGIARHVPDVREQFAQDLRRVSDDGDIHADVLADRGRVHVNVHDLGGGREGIHAPSHAVVEPRTDGEDQVRFGDRVVGRRRAVHAEHAEREAVVAGEGAQAHQRHAHRRIGGLGQLAQFLRGVGKDHAAAHEQDRLLRLVQGRSGETNLPRMALRARLVAGKADAFVRLAFQFRHCDIHRNVHDHRPRPPAARDVERLLDHPGQVVQVLDQVIVLRDRARDAGRVRLLESVVADQVRPDLAGDRDHGDGVHVGGRDSGGEVRRSRAGSGDADAHAAGRTRIAVRSVRRGLFMADHHEPDRRFVQRVEQRQDRAARIAEDDLRPFLDQRFDQDLRAFFRHF